MRDIKIRYIVRHKASGNIEVKHYYLNQIEQRPLKELSPAFLADYETLSRDLFTGLKDKNGKEIYEQDILEVESFEGSKSVVRVVFDDGCFCHIGHLGDLRTYPLRDFLFNGSKVQVIGNIFQHPHLLEESK